MKKGVKILGIDDAPFYFREDKTIVIGVVMRGGGYIEGVIRREITVDGDDATDTCIEMILTTRHRQQLKATLLDGVSLGGFNVVDIERIYDETGIPIVTVTRDKPDLERIREALKKHFKDWKRRFSIITNGKLFTVETQHNPIYVKCAGIDSERAKEIITLSTIRGVIPEPIRVAHIIASAIVRGESYGKA